MILWNVCGAVCVDGCEFRNLDVSVAVGVPTEGELTDVVARFDAVVGRRRSRGPLRMATVPLVRSAFDWTSQEPAWELLDWLLNLGNEKTAPPQIDVSGHDQIVRLLWDDTDRLATASLVHSTWPDAEAVAAVAAELMEVAGDEWFEGALLCEPAPPPLAILLATTRRSVRCAVSRPLPAMQSQPDTPGIHHVGNRAGPSARQSSDRRTPGDRRGTRRRTLGHITQA